MAPERLRASASAPRPVSSLRDACCGTPGFGSHFHHFHATQAWLHVWRPNRVCRIAVVQAIVHHVQYATALQQYLGNRLNTLIVYTPPFYLDMASMDVSVSANACECNLRPYFLCISHYLDETAAIHFCSSFLYSHQHGTSNGWILHHSLVKM